MRDPGSESVRALSDLLERGTTSPWSLNAMAPDLATAQALADRLRDVPEVGRVITVSDFVAEDQEEKLGIIEDIGTISFITWVAAVAGPVVLYGLVQWSGRGKWLFERPAWAHIDRPARKEAVQPAE